MAEESDLGSGGTEGALARGGDEQVERLLARALAARRAVRGLGELGEQRVCALSLVERLRGIAARSVERACRGHDEIVCEIAARLRRERLHGVAQLRPLRRPAAVEEAAEHAVHRLAVHRVALRARLRRAGQPVRLLQRLCGSTARRREQAQVQCGETPLV